MMKKCTIESVLVSHSESCTAYLLIDERTVDMIYSQNIDHCVPLNNLNHPQSSDGYIVMQ